MNKLRTKESGGTLLGLIIGLIIGLGIAVGVAVVITKTPVPFLNKSGKQEKAAELTAGQVADPNKPMYGKQEAAKAAAKDFVKEPEAEVIPAAAGANQPAVDKPKAPDNAEVKVAAKPEAAKPENADDKWVYYLQAGAFREPADAESTKAKLALQGLEAAISEKLSDNGPLYRVRLGPYNQLEAMNRVRGKLSESGIDVAVLRIPK